MPQPIIAEIHLLLQKSLVNQFRIDLSGETESLVQGVPPTEPTKSSLPASIASADYTSLLVFKNGSPSQVPIAVDTYSNGNGVGDWYIVILENMDDPSVPADRYLEVNYSRSQWGISYDKSTGTTYCSLTPPSLSFGQRAWGYQENYKWGLRSYSKPTWKAELGTTPLELYCVYPKLPNYFMTNGIPLTLLRMFLLPIWLRMSGPVWPQTVAGIVFGSRQPVTGMEKNTKDHWLKYNVWGGAPTFVRSYDGGDFALSAWLQAYRDWKKDNTLYTPVNCYDQAGVVELALSLGMDHNTIAWEFRQPYGYFDSSLVGWGRCNNPYFRFDRDRMLVGENDIEREPFRNHVYIAISDSFANGSGGQIDFRGNKINPQNFDLTESRKIVDACAGPTGGDQTFKEYYAKIRQATAPADHLQSTGSWATNCFWTAGITGKSNTTQVATLQKVYNESFVGSDDGTTPGTIDISTLEGHAQNIPGVSSQIIQSLFNDFASIVTKYRTGSYTNQTIHKISQSQAANVVTVEKRLWQKGTAYLPSSFIYLRVAVTDSLETALRCLKTRVELYHVPEPTSIKDTITLQPKSEVASGQPMPNVDVVGGQYLRVFVLRNLLVEIGTLGQLENIEPGVTENTVLADIVRDVANKIFRAGTLTDPTQWQTIVQSVQDSNP